VSPTDAPQRTVPPAPARPRWRAPILILLASLVLLAGGAAVLLKPGASSPAGPPGAIRAGARAPEFQLADLAGQPVSLARLRGQAVWMNFWAAWCPACTTEMPRIAQKAQQYQGQGLVILSIDLQESPGTVQSWVQGRFGGPVLLDSAGHVADLYRIAGLPSHVFIDRAGVIQGVTTGAITAAQMDAAIVPLLAR
jgi:cytochrome c biogenesis protein CcmG/thiol:disulfide interchange protein DsbE